MKVNVIENVERKTVTVILGGVRFYSAKFLLERYDEKRYFGHGILKIDRLEMNEILKKIAMALNSVKPDVKVTAKMLFEGDDVDYPLFRPTLNQNGEADGTFQISLNVQSDKRERNLFFADLERTKPITNEDVIKEHEWGVELELNSTLDEETLDTKIYAVLHRIIKGKKADTKYQTNDSAWGGFDLGDETSDDDDKPF